jgi:hypothetical protein
VLDVSDPHPLIDLAREVLRSEKFRIGSLELPELDQRLVVAEDEYSLAGIVAADDWAGLRHQVGRTDVALSNWAAVHGPIEKRWDIYLVCMVQRSLGEPQAFAEAERFAADTTRVRKYVRDGVLPEEPNVRAALAPLLPLQFSGGATVVDPLQALEVALRTRGIDSDLAHLAIENFIATREIRVRR